MGIIMSDEEYYEEEEVTSNTSKKGDGNFLKARQEAKKGELDEQLREYINEKRKRLEEAEKKRQAMMQAQKEKQQAAGQGAKGTVKKADSGMGNVQDARREMTKTKEQLEGEKKQAYDLKELKERQKQQLRQKAMKKGLDPEALTGKYPPKIRMYSKYERRTDTRTYEDRRKLYEGG